MSVRESKRIDPSLLNARVSCPKPPPSSRLLSSFADGEKQRGLFNETQLSCSISAGTYSGKTSVGIILACSDLTNGRSFSALAGICARQLVTSAIRSRNRKLANLRTEQRDQARHQVENTEDGQAGTNRVFLRFLDQLLNLDVR